MSVILPHDNGLRLDSLITRSADQVSCDLSSHVVVLGFKSGAYYGLDPVAARIWELLEEPRTIEQLRDRILEEFDGVESERCASDLCALMRQLAEAQLIVVGSSASD